MTVVQTVRLRTILDSRGDATVEADVLTERGGFGRAAAPAGASTGRHEAVSLPADEAVTAAREHVVPRLEGRVDAADQRAVDAAIVAADGTDAFERVGANAAVAVSMAAAAAGADVLGTPLFQHLGGTFRGHDLPVPLGNVVGGGAHAVTGPDVQEFLAIPYGAPNVADAVFANARVHERAGAALAAHDDGLGLGDEGAWAPAVDTETALEVLAEVAEAVAEEVGFVVGLGLDVAASERYDGAADHYRFDGVERDPEAHRDWIVDLVERYDLRYVEDPVEEDDLDGLADLTRRVESDVAMCGDDLFVTDADRIAEGAARSAGSAVIIKPNQVGTLSGAMDAIDAARIGGLDPVVSHRSGETTDATIAHLAVAAGCRYIKTGTIGGERTAKLNELIRISQHAT